MRNGPYILVVAPSDYPGKKYRGRYVYEHHLIWWKSTGNVVRNNYVIHHKNENKRDNRIENLEEQTREDHSRDHIPFVDSIEVVCFFAKINFIFYHTGLDQD